MSEEERQPGLGGGAGWVERADRLLAKAARRTRLLGSLTPANAAEERARLQEALARGEALCPRWTYPALGGQADRAEHEELVATLERAADHIAKDANPLAEHYAARARELALEARLSMAAGTARLPELAQKRFSATSAEAAREASSLAHAWIADAETAGECARTSDGPEPESLFSRMQAEIGRLRLPFTVLVQPSLASLAATGDRTILIAAGRMVTDDDIARTVLHEVHGHAEPRARASTLAPRLFAIGTARGADEQEGLAILLEERHGFLGARRRRMLAARHLVVLAMREGATFAEAATDLVRARGVRAEDAIVIAERVFRGGDGTHAGLGRERVYLEAFARVRAHLAARPEDERVLASGQVAVDAAAALAPFVPIERTAD